VGKDRAALAKDRADLRKDEKDVAKDRREMERIARTCARIDAKSATKTRSTSKRRSGRRGRVPAARAVFFSARQRWRAK
jgi:hypothetical protein